MKKITIKSIAEKAGVSVATVSKVINNCGNISDQTKDKVLSIIQQNRFVPQQRKQKGNVLGVIMFSFKNAAFLSNYDSMVFGGICREAFAHGYDVTVIDVEKIAAMSPYELHCYFLSNSLSCAVLLGYTATEEFRDIIKKSEIPFIAIGDMEETNCIYSKSGEAVAAMIDYMICLGHRKIAYMGLITDRILDHTDRFNAYRKVLEENQIPVKEEYILNLPNAGPLTILNALQRLIARHDPPDALFFESELFSKVIDMLQKLKIKVPQELSVAGFYCSDDPICGMRPSAIIQPNDMLGRCAVNNLLSRLDVRSDDLRIKLDCQIIYGETIGKI